MQPIEMHLDNSMSIQEGDEEFLYFSADWDNNHGGEEITLKKSRWEALGSPEKISVYVTPGLSATFEQVLKEQGEAELKRLGMK